MKVVAAALAESLMCTQAREPSGTREPLVPLHGNVQFSLRVNVSLEETKVDDVERGTEGEDIVRSDISDYEASLVNGFHHRNL